MLLILDISTSCWPQDITHRLTSLSMSPSTQAWTQHMSHRQDLQTINGRMTHQYFLHFALVSITASLCTVTSRHVIQWRRHGQNSCPKELLRVTN